MLKIFPWSVGQNHPPQSLQDTNSLTFHVIVNAGSISASYRKSFIIAERMKCPHNLPLPWQGEANWKCCPSLSHTTTPSRLHLPPHESDMVMGVSASLLGTEAWQVDRSDQDHNSMRSRTPSRLSLLFPHNPVTEHAAPVTVQSEMLSHISAIQAT